ncbi:MAG: DMT family transporter [Deltaproteobacteria bacterium]|nr:DMT family transporter [Deltaproteobacteria bacterium]
MTSGAACYALTRIPHTVYRKPNTLNNNIAMISIYIKLLMTAIFWGGTFIAGRVVSGHVNPYAAAFLRFVVASFFLVLLLAKEEGLPRRVEAKKTLALVMLGATGVFAYNLFFFKGLQLISAGRASLIIANNPIFLAIFSFLLFKEKMTPLKVIGILISVTGAVIAISGGNPTALLSGGVGMGDVYIFCCVCFWVAYSLIGKKAMDTFSPLAAVTGAAVTGVLLLFIPAWQSGMLAEMARYRPADWAAIFYLGIFGTVLGFVWYYDGIKAIGPARAGLFINFVPLSAIVMGYLILGEAVTISLAAGAALVISGVVLTNTASVRLPK